MTTKPILIAAAILFLCAHTAFSTPTIYAQTGECSPAKPTAESGSNRYTMTSGDMQREYLVFVPGGYDPSQQTALVMTLHGYTSDALEIQVYTDWNTVAERENFIAVYPQSTGDPTAWFAYERDDTYTGPATTDDVQFIRDLIGQLSEDYCVDPSRIYVNGMSNGGGMTHRIACEVADQVAAVGMVAGAFVEDQPCDPTRPIPVMAFHGTDDSTVPYRGLFYFPPVQAWAAQWAERNGCDPTPEDLPAQGVVNGIAYTDCDDDADVIFYTIDGGEHVWPGASPFFDSIVNPATRDISATETLWKFFVEHPMSNNGAG